MYNRAMIHGYATLLLILGALASAFLYLWGEQIPAVSRSRPYFLPLTLVLIFLIALIVPTPVSIYYKAAILLGLILVLLGSSVYLLAGAPPVVNKAHWLIAFLLFMTAFAALHPLKLPTPWLLLLLLYTGAIAWRLWPRLAELQISIAIYGVALLLMTWQALEVLVTGESGWSLLPFVGALLLVVADSLEAVDHFDRPLPATKTLIPAFLLLGQLLLALSIWGAGLSNALA